MSYNFDEAHKRMNESWERVRVALELDKQLRFHSGKMGLHPSYTIVASTQTYVYVPTAIDPDETENRSDEDIDAILKRRFLDELIETRDMINNFLQAHGR